MSSANFPPCAVRPDVYETNVPSFHLRMKVMVQIQDSCSPLFKYQNT